MFTAFLLFTCLLDTALEFCSKFIKLMGCDLVVPINQFSGRGNLLSKGIELVCGISTHWLKLALLKVIDSVIAGTKKMGDWKFGLVKSMDDPALQVFADDKIVIIKDKYPKSTFHYLALPKENINGINSLNSSNLPILKYMELQARNFLKEHEKGLAFWLGFHAVPSLQRLHLHLISDDFKGSGLKTAKHWNSFTTRFFIPISKIIRDIEIHGSAQIPNKTICDGYLKTKLKCHKCSFEPSNMPKLKDHLFNH